MDVSDDAWTRLGRMIRSRRNELKLSAQGAADLAGFSRTTWINAETAERQLSERLWSGVDQSLGWELGSVAAILDGGDPKPAVTQPSSPGGALAGEVERIKGLTHIPAKDRIRMITALLDLYEEEAARRPT